MFAILANAKSERCGFEGLGAYGWGVRGVAHRDEREAQMWAPYGFRGPHVRGGPRSGKLLFASLRADVSARLPEAVSGEGGFTCERFAPSGSPRALRPVAAPRLVRDPPCVPAALGCRATRCISPVADTESKVWPITFLGVAVPWVYILFRARELSKMAILEPWLGRVNTRAGVYLDWPYP